MEYADQLLAERKIMNKNYIWVIEILLNGVYSPTIGANITRKESREELKTWKEKNPADHFRVAKYISGEG